MATAASCGICGSWRSLFRGNSMGLHLRPPPAPMWALSSHYLGQFCLPPCPQNTHQSLELLVALPHSAEARRTLGVLSGCQKCALQYICHTFSQRYPHTTGDKDWALWIGPWASLMKRGRFRTVSSSTFLAWVKQFTMAVQSATNVM